MKTHKREVHYKGPFVCFVRTHQELKQKKGCKSSAPKQIVHKHNDEMQKENEHKCPVSKNYRHQVSLAHHINKIHKSNKNKCDSCGQEFENRGTLIEHSTQPHRR